MTFSVHILGGNNQYSRMFSRRGWSIEPNIDKADVIQFTGGSDVSPAYYFHHQHPQTGNNLQRDERESDIFRRYRGHKPLLGICRGGQFLWVMNEGAMYQHVHGHAIHGTHPVIDLDTFDIREVTSTHHQMMMHTPATINKGMILAVASHCTHKEWMSSDLYARGKSYTKGKDQFDIEVAFFNDTKSLCFQPHPEFGEGDCQDYYFELIEKHIVPRINQG